MEGWAGSCPFWRRNAGAPPGTRLAIASVPQAQRCKSEGRTGAAVADAPEIHFNLRLRMQMVGWGRAGGLISHERGYQGLVRVVSRLWSLTGFRALVSFLREVSGGSVKQVGPRGGLKNRSNLWEVALQPKDPTSETSNPDGCNSFFWMSLEFAWDVNRSRGWACASSSTRSRSASCRHVAQVPSSEKRLCCWFMLRLENDSNAMSV